MILCWNGHYPEKNERRNVLMKSVIKRSTTAFVAAAVVMSLSIPAHADTSLGNALTVNQFPEAGTPVYTIDKLDQFGTYYEGLWEGTVSTSHGERTYKIYVPIDCRRDASAYYIALPDGVLAEEFLVKSGWIDLAEKDKIVLCIFEPSNQQWGSADTEADYFTQAYSQFNGTTYVYHDIFNWRWIGYGTGGEMMQRHIMNNPMTAAAAVIVDGSNKIDAAYLEQVGAQHFSNQKTIFDVTYGETPVPMWIISKEITPNTRNVINYWKTANDVTGTAVQLKDGYQFTQDPFSSSIFTYDQKVGTIRVSQASYDYTNQSLTQQAYEFVNQFARSGTGSPYSNSLTRSVPDDTFIHEIEVIDGYQREWFVYLPSSYSDSGEPMPLVIYYHGTGQSGLLSMRQGDWWKLAEEKGFIAVCPSASLELARSPQKIPQMSWNVESYGNADDIVFTKELIQHMDKHYNIDLGRVYATGQSNGGRMSIYAGLALPKMITAVASAGASSLTTATDPEHPEAPETYYLPPELDESYIVPFMATLGEYDNFNFDLTDPKSDSYLRCHYFCDRYDLNYEDYLTYTNGRNTHSIWLNEGGVPLQEQVVIGLRAHSHRPAENQMMWDEWFCHYTRDPDSGTLYYMGRAVE